MRAPQMKTIERGFEGTSELIPIDKCDKAYLKKLPFGTYPYCKEHGAMLAVEKKCEVWRCATCGLGIIWEEVKKSE